MKKENEKVLNVQQNIIDKDNIEKTNNNDDNDLIKVKLLKRSRKIYATLHKKTLAKLWKDKQKLKELLQKEAPRHNKSFGRIRYFPTFPSKYEPTDLSKCDATSKRHTVRRDYQRVGVIAQKVGMMNLFDDAGINRAITICRVDNCQVVQIKHEQNTRTGTYNLQLGYGSQKIRRLHWAQLGHFAKHKVPLKRRLMEFSVGRKALLPIGTEITCRHFLPGQLVDVQGVTKGKGFCGVMKRWGFRGGPASHGSTKFHRRRGALSHKGWTFKGKRMAGKMGNKKHTKLFLRVFRIEPKLNLIYLVGSVPGWNNGYLKIRDSHFGPPKNPPFPTFFPDPNEKELPNFTQMKNTRSNYYEKDSNPETWGDKILPDLL